MSRASPRRAARGGCRRSVIAARPPSGASRQIQAAAIIRAASSSLSTSRSSSRRCHRDDQAEPDDDLGRGDGHHGEREDLAVAAAVVAREGDQGEVRAVQHDLEREQDDQRATPQQHAERAGREEERGDRQVPPDVRALHARLLFTFRRAWLAEDDPADGGDEQDDRRDLEGEQVVGQEQLADLVRAAEAPRDLRACESRAAGLQPDHDDDLHDQRSGGGDRAERLPAWPAGPGRVRLRRRGRR